MIDIVQEQGWVAVTARNWWAANQALDRRDPLFTIEGAPLDDKGMDAALDGRFSTAAEASVSSRGAISIRSSTARRSSGRTTHWRPRCISPWSRWPRPRGCANGLGRGVDADTGACWRAMPSPMRWASAAHDVTVYPLFAGGSFGIKMEVDAGVQPRSLPERRKRPSSSCGRARRTSSAMCRARRPGHGSRPGSATAASSPAGWPRWRRHRLFARPGRASATA